MSNQDLALNNQQWLICLKANQPDQHVTTSLKIMGVLTVLNPLPSCIQCTQVKIDIILLSAAKILTDNRQFCRDMLQVYDCNLQSTHH